MSYLQMSTKPVGYKVLSTDWNQMVNNLIAGVPDIFTTAGDLAYATGADAAARLGIGSAGQVLKTNDGGTAPEWQDAKYIVEIPVISAAATLAVGEGIFEWTIPERFNGYNIVSVHCAVHTVSSSGLPTFQLFHRRHAADILSTEVTIDESEYNSYTATTPHVIDTDYDDLQTGDRIAFDCDVAGTAQGWDVIIELEKP